MWEGEDEAAVADLTPKQRLLGWIQNKIPQLPVTNFSRDWQDGRALGALVDGCAPGIFSIYFCLLLCNKAKFLRIINFLIAFKHYFKSSIKVDNQSGFNTIIIV